MAAQFVNTLTCTFYEALLKKREINKIALWISIRANYWTTERAIIARKGLPVVMFFCMTTSLDPPLNHGHVGDNTSLRALVTSVHLPKELSLRVFTEFSEFSDKKSIKNYKECSIWIHYLLCKRQRWYLSTTETRVIEKILKLNPIHD